MPPKKRPQGKSTVVSDRPTRAKRAKTIRPSELREVAPEAVSTTTSHSQTEQTPVPHAGSVDVSTLPTPFLPLFRKRFSLHFPRITWLLFSRIQAPAPVLWSV